MANTLRFKRGLVTTIPTAALGEPLFTTDTFDLYIGNGTTNTRFQKYIASGATTQILRGDGSLYTFPLAISSPSAGQVLKYNGTSWVNDSDAGITGSGTLNYIPRFLSSTSVGNSVIVQNGTFIGIGTASADYALTVGGSINVGQPGVSLGILLVDILSSIPSSSVKATIGVTNSGFGYSAGALLLQPRTGVGAALVFATEGTEKARFTSTGNFIINNASTDNGLRFQVTGDGYFSGSVGIGTSSLTANRYLNIGGANTNGIRIATSTAPSVYYTDIVNYYSAAKSFEILNGGISVISAAFQGYASIQLGSSTALNYDIRTSDSYFVWRNQSTDLLRLTSSGNLGLGVTPSAWSTAGPALQLKGTSIVNYANNYASSFATNAYYNTSDQWVYYTSTYRATRYQQVDGVHTWSTAASGTANAAITFTQAMTLDASGNLLVGGTSVYGATITSYGSSTRSGGIGIRNSAGTIAGFFGTYAAGSGSGSTDILAEAAGFMSISTGGSERHRFFSGGNVGIGTTTDAGFKLDVNGTMRSSSYITAATEFRLNNNTFSRAAIIDTNGAIAGGYNFKLTSNVPQHDSTGAISGYYYHNNGYIGWYTGTSQAANTNATERMRLDASGNLAVGTTTTTNRLEVWGSGNTAARIVGQSAGNATLILSSGGVTAYSIKSGNGDSSLRIDQDGTERIMLASGGNLLIGTTTNSTFKLDVNGTMRVSGASTFNGAMTLSINQNAGTILSVSNTTSGTASAAYASFTSSNGNLQLGKRSATTNTYKILIANDSFIYNDNSGDIGILNDFASGSIKMAAGGSSTAHFTIASTGAATFSSSVTAASLNINTSGQSRAFNTFYTAGTDGLNIYIGGGGASSTGTGSQGSYNTSLGVSALNANTTGYYNTGVGMSALVANTSGYGNSAIGLFALYSNTTGYNNTAIGTSAGYGTGTNANTTGANNIFIGNQSVGVSATENNRTWIGNSGTTSTWLGGRLLLGSTTDDGVNRLQVTGAATFSSSVQAATAIAIGTTPDTNKPFKILKNINGTVGINFENTSTGSLAFSAIQMGTDVTGGTKFTNLVYASSGVTASGVYNPDGTSLINNGSGGLNFLGNPIRMYTGGSNGVLRWDMTNDGFITQYTGTNPSTNATDGYRQYSADVVAGNAAPHFRTENGAVIKLYQETTAVGNAIISLGGGNAVLDDTTFDGYTLRQIVKALRNQGILQ